MQHFSNKIIALTVETPRRSAPPIDIASMDFFGSIENIFMNVTTLSQEPLRVEISRLQKDFPSLASGEVSDLFDNSSFVERFNSNSNSRHALTLLVHDLIKKGKGENAHAIASGMSRLFTQIPHGPSSKKIEDEKVRTMFLLALSEPHFNARTSALKRICKLNRAEARYYALAMYYLVREYVLSGKITEAEKALGEEESLNGSIVDPMVEILKGDIRWAKKDLKDALIHYRRVRHIAEKVFEKTGTDIDSYGDMYRALLEKCFSIKGTESGRIGIQRASSHPEIKEDMVKIMDFEMTNTLLLASYLKEAEILLELKREDDAQKIYEAAIERVELGVFARFGKQGYEALFLTLGEFVLAQGKEKAARFYFEEAGDCLHALTRLNEMDYERVETMSPEDARAAVSRIYREVKFREQLGGEYAGENILLARLQHFRFAEACRSPQMVNSALRGIVETEGNRPVGMMALLYLAHFADASTDVKNGAKKADIVPANYELDNPATAQAADLFFGIRNHDDLVESLRTISLELRKAEPSSISEALTVPDPKEYEELLSVFPAEGSPGEKKIFRAFRDFWQDEVAYVYNLEIINPFKALDQARITSFKFQRDYGSLTINTTGGMYFELDFGPDFHFEKTKDKSFNRLLTLLIMDLFLRYQKAEGYVSVLDKIPYSTASESGWLTQTALDLRWKETADQWEVIAERPPTKSEETIRDLEQKMPPSPADRSQDKEEQAELGEEKAIFEHETSKKLAEELRKTPTVRIDISKDVSLDPLAAYLHYANIWQSDSGIEIKIVCSGGNIFLRRSNDGTFEITDRNQGQTSFAMMRRLNKVLLAALNYRFNVRYKAAAASGNRRQEIQRIYIEVQNTASAREKKASVYETMINPPFKFRALKGMAHPFDSQYFELVDAQESIYEPRPKMTAKLAAQAVKEGKQIVQIAAVDITTRVTKEGKINRRRIEAYVLRYVMGVKKRLKDISGEERRRIDVIIRQIASGRKQDSLLHPDPGYEWGVSFDDVTFFSGEMRRTPRNFVSSHLRRYKVSPVTGEAELEASSAKASDAASGPEPASKTEKKHTRRGRRKKSKGRKQAAKPAPAASPAKPAQISPTQPAASALDKRKKMLLQANRNVQARKTLDELKAYGYGFIEIARRTWLPLPQLIKLSKREVNVDPRTLQKLQNMLVDIKIDLGRKDD